MKFQRKFPLLICAMLALCPISTQRAYCATAKADLTGRYEGTAKNTQGEVIQVSFELTEKDNAVSGVIHSSHGDFTISRGSHQGDTVTLEFETGGPTGTITLKQSEDKLVGTWTAGDDNGPVEVKRAGPQEDAPKGKS